MTCNHKWVMYQPLLGEAYECCALAGCGITKDEFDKQRQSALADLDAEFLKGINGEMDAAWEVWRKSRGLLTAPVEVDHGVLRSLGLTVPQVQDPSKQTGKSGDPINTSTKDPDHLKWKKHPAYELLEDFLEEYPQDLRGTKC